MPFWDFVSPSFCCIIISKSVFEKTMLKKILLGAFLIVLTLGAFSSALAQNGASTTEATSPKKVEITLFYSKTCPHCAAELDFLPDLEEKYDQLQVNKYVASQNVPLLKEYFQNYDANKRYLGSVPLTFIDDELIPGFDNARGVGRVIENEVRKNLGLEPLKKSREEQVLSLPLVGKLDASNYSLPVLSVIMGTLDGFNVCSLGALALILGLVMTFKSRKKIFIFGGIFILTTALVYGILIVLWYKLFATLAPYMRFMEYLVALLIFGGAAYFFKEFWRMKREGPKCEGNFAQGLTDRLKKKVKGEIEKDASANLWGIAGAILIFAATLTIVEFPCSAAVPVAYAGILSTAELPTITYLFYIAIFVFFYLLDELIVFGIAVWKLKIWMESPRFVKWTALVEAIVLFLLGLSYLFGMGL